MMRFNTRQRRGITLLELLVVVLLISIFSSVVIARAGRSLLANQGAQMELRRLALDLRQMQRLSITSGDAHGIVFLTDGGGRITGYRIVSGLVPIAGGYAEGPATTDVDSRRSFTADITVTTTQTAVGFNFEGQAAAAHRMTMRGPDRAWQLDVIPITGGLHVTDISW